MAQNLPLPSIDRILKADKIVIDTETTGLDWRFDRTVGFVVSWREGNSIQSRYLPIRHQGGNLDEKVVIAWMRELAAFSPDKLIVGHNLKFDLHFLANDDIFFKGPKSCTLNRASLIDENAGKFDLHHVALRFGATPKVDIAEKLADMFGVKVGKEMGHFHKLPGDHSLVVEYATGDGISTLEVHENQQEEIDHQELGWADWLENQVIDVLFDMERRGIRVDEEALDSFAAEITRLLERSTDAVSKAGIENVKSRLQVEKAFVDAGVTDFDVTDKGNQSFNEAWLLTKGGELGQAIVDYRKLRTLMENFIVPMEERHLWNGRVHTNFNQTKRDDYGTVTRRLSSNNPNMQQVPKRGDPDLCRKFRAIFCPDEGMLWSANDYSQQELRVFTHYTKCKRMLEGYNSDPPVDGHSVVSEMLGIPRDGQGVSAKRMNLGMLYMMGALALSGHMNCSRSEAMQYIKLYRDQLPEVVQFNKMAEARAKRRGWVKSIMGGRRHFPDPRFAHKAGNAVIQMTSAEITKLKMVEIHHYFRRVGAPCDLLLQVHDELNWQFPAEGAEWDHQAQWIMQDFGAGDGIDTHGRIQLSLPLPVDHKEGANWGEATYGRGRS